ncbi:MAG: bifunctional DNA primase/polymerase [Pirellulales bacterium]|nr:bifunctional DNA primase/polymerase [Pirellulales bacterium]
MKSNEDYALLYAKTGWRVLPVHAFADGLCTCDDEQCHSPAKHPITTNGCKDATTDVETINRWWRETNGMANVAIATGNGLLVLDVDAKSDGLSSLAELERANGTLPLTPMVETGGGGRHYFFSCPAETSIGNRAAIVQGIDVRGEGGYVVAPPSLHASGSQYRWATPDDTPLAQVPYWLLELLAKPRTPSNNGAVVSTKLLTVPHDLVSDPGTPEGQRHTRLCQLVGVHLARGEAAEDVLALALAWSERCQPPIDFADVHRVVNDLSAMKPLAADEHDEAIESIPLPEARAWPALGNDALHGLAGEVVRTIEPHTEADAVAILVSLLVSVGNYVGRRAWYRVEGDRHHANLFACLVGDSSKARKGTSLGRTLTLWDDRNEWKEKRIVNGLSSGEGLKWAVRDAIEATEPVKEKGKVVGYQNVIKDPGVDDKRLLVVESEFAQVLKVAQREGNTVSPVLRQAWDSGTLRTLTRNDPAVATDAHISVLGHITRHELERLLSATDCSNGFANRFLWVAVKRSKLLPDGGGRIDLSSLRERLSKALCVTGEMSRSPACRDLWHSLYPKLSGDRPGIWGAVTSRAEAQTLRLSMVYALLDGTTTIDEPHLRAAHAVWKYAEASARLLFDDADALAPLEQAILEKVTATPGINRKGLHKALGGHVPARSMVDSLGKLVALGKARAETVSTGGRPSECWYPVVATAAVIATQRANEQSLSLALPIVDPSPTDNGTEAKDRSFARSVSSTEVLTEEEFDAEIAAM